MSLNTSRIILLGVSTQSERPIATETRLMTNWPTVMTIVLLVALLGPLLLPPGLALAEDSPSDNGSSDGIGIQVASWALTVPYAIGKGAFAVGGAIVGGLGYMFSGGNYNTAKSVWTRSIYGTYLIRPEHLRGEEPVHFLGTAGESQAEVAPSHAPPTPENITPQKK
jgi:hypothetical protein